MVIVNLLSFLLCLLFLLLAWYSRLRHGKAFLPLMVSAVFFACFLWATVQESERVLQNAEEAAVYHESEAMKQMEDGGRSQYQRQIDERERALLSAYTWDPSDPDWQSPANYATACAVFQNVMLARAVSNPANLAEQIGQLRAEPTHYLGEGFLTGGICVDAGCCDAAVSAAFLPDESNFQMLWERYEVDVEHTTVQYVILSPGPVDASMPQVGQYGRRAAIFIGNGWMGDQDVSIFLCN